MTFSLLARDPETGALGGVAATGNLCVGGWVLRGDARAGMSASQGKTPSTLWGEDSLQMLADGLDPPSVVSELTASDAGCEDRQLSVLGVDGATAAFDGAGNHPFTGHIQGEGWVVAGNWLATAAVIEQASAAFEGAGGFADRLLAALRAGVTAGSDSRGTLSAAMLVVGCDRPPLSLRIDWDEEPVEKLEALLKRTREPGYAAWLETLPTRNRPEAT